MKGKDMILSDFLSQQNSDDSNPSEIIPISFNIYKILEDNRNFANAIILLIIQVPGKIPNTDTFPS